MTEFDAMQKTNGFQSKITLKEQLRTLGIQSGDAIMVHSALSQMGWIAGAEQAVVEALTETITTEGTIVMPAQSVANSEPAYWALPPAPIPWHQAIRDTMPAYDPHLTPLRGMGKIAECFLRHPNTIRSLHPAHSFMAWGKYAKEWMSEHPLECSFGLASPLGKIHQHDVKIILIGVDYDSCTALHLAEYLVEEQTFFPQGAAMMVNDERRWVTYEMLNVNSERFPKIGAAFEEVTPTAITYGMVGLAHAKVIPMRPLVEFGIIWLNQNPEPPVE